MMNRTKLSQLLIILLAFFSYTTLFAQTEISEEERQAAEKYNEALTLVNDGEQYALALPLFQEAIDLDSNNPSFYYMAGVCLQKTDQLDAAVASLKKAKEIADTMPDDEAAKSTSDKSVSALGVVLLQLAQNALKSDQYSEALTYLSESKDYKEVDATYYQMSMVAHNKLGDTASTIEDMKKIIELSEEGNRAAENAKSNLSKMYLKAGAEGVKAKDYTAAVSNLDEAAKYSDLNASGYYLYTLAHNALKNYDKAIESANKAIELETNATKKWQYHYQIALAYKAQGNNSATKAAYRDAISSGAPKQYADRFQYEIDNM